MEENMDRTVDLNSPFWRLRLYQVTENGPDWRTVKKDWTQEASNFLVKADVTLRLGFVISGTLQFEMPIEKGLGCLQQMSQEGTGWFRFGAGYKIKYGYYNFQRKEAEGWCYEVPMLPIKPDLTIKDFVRFTIDTFGEWGFWAKSPDIDKLNGLIQGGEVTVKKFLDFLKEEGYIYNYEGLTPQQLSLPLLSSKEDTLGAVFAPGVSLWDVLRYYVWPRLGYYWFDIDFKFTDDGIIISPLPRQTESKFIFGYKYRPDFDGIKPIMPFSEFSSRPPIWFYEGESGLEYFRILEEDKKTYSVRVDRAPTLQVERAILQNDSGWGNENIKTTKVDVEPGAKSREVLKKEMTDELYSKIITNYSADLVLGYLFPRVMPGDWIEIVGLGNNLYGGNYVVTSVEHSLVTDWNTSLHLIRDEEWVSQFFV